MMLQFPLRWVQKRSEISPSFLVTMPLQHLTVGSEGCWYKLQKMTASRAEGKKKCAMYGNSVVNSYIPQDLFVSSS